MHHSLLTSLWSERDKAIAAGAEKLNNLNIKEYATDKDADYRCKGTDKYWYGYKRHVAVECRSGMILKVAAASLTDAGGLKHICPRQGIVLAGYCTKEAQAIIIMVVIAEQYSKNNMRMRKKTDF